ncbi:MAG TPA: AAA family ATPase [Longimicrobiaceae bacterium]|nr:AAA family ATPase [Longimicrobiaceae bacterium]
MRNRENPFQYGRELSASELVDRADEIEVLLSTIRNRGKLFLIGPRRFGKTSLLAAAAGQVDESQVAMVRINAEAFESLSSFAQELTSAAARALRTPVARANQWAQATLTRLRPKIAVGPEGLGIEFGLGDYDNIQTIVDALDAVEELAATHKRTLIIVIDEVQELILGTGLAAEKQLRSAVQRHRNTSYIFAGSATRLLHEMTNEPNRPFYRLGARMFLGPIPRLEFGDFIQRTFGNSKIAISAEAVEQILDRARDVPYNVQRLAHEVWEMTRAGTLQSPLKTEDIDRALTRIVAQEAPAHTALWRSLTATQKKALKAVIEQDGHQLHSHSVSRQYGIARSSLQRALETLETRQLVRQNLGEIQTRYLLVDPFFGAWLEHAQQARSSTAKADDD